MDRETFLRYYLSEVVVVAATVFLVYVIAMNAPLSEEAIARRVIEQSNNPPVTESAPGGVMVSGDELAPEKIQPEIENLSIFGFKAVCVSSVAEDTVHGALELLANEIGTSKIPMKYIEMDKTKTITPDSFKWTWQSYWKKTEIDKKVCIILN